MYSLEVSIQFATEQSKLIRHNYVYLLTLALFDIHFFSKAPISYKLMAETPKQTELLNL